MTYPFAGEIKMTKVIKDGKEVIEWEPVNMTYHADGNVGIGTPSQAKWDGSAPLVIGEPVERMRISMTDGLGITPGNGGEFMFTKPATEWARVDKDLNVTHLDMDLCRNGEQNAYTALAIAIWDAATKAAQKEWQGLTADEMEGLYQMATYMDETDYIHMLMTAEAKLKEKNNV